MSLLSRMRESLEQGLPAWVYLFLALSISARYFEKTTLAVALSLALLVALYDGIKNKDYHLKHVFSLKNYYEDRSGLLMVISVCLLALSWLVSSLLAIDVEAALSKWVGLFGITLGGVLIFPYLKKNVALFSHSFSLYLYLTITVIALYAGVDQIMMLGESVKEPFYSAIIALVLPFMIHEILKSDKISLYIPLIIVVAVMFLCNGRSGWMGAFAGLVFMVGFRFFTPLAAAIWHRLAVVVACGTGAVIGLWGNYLRSDPEVFINRMTLNESAGTGTGRLKIWDFTVEQAMNNPVFGTGFKGYRQLDFSSLHLSSNMHPHNAILEIMLETGLVGLGLFFIFGGVVFWRWMRTFLKSRRIKTEKSKHNLSLLIAGGASMTAYLTASLTMTSFFHAWWFAYFMVLIMLVELGRHNAVSSAKI